MCIIVFCHDPFLTNLWAKLSFVSPSLSPSPLFLQSRRGAQPLDPAQTWWASPLVQFWGISGQGHPPNQGSSSGKEGDGERPPEVVRQKTHTQGARGKGLFMVFYPFTRFLVTMSVDGILDMRLNIGKEWERNTALCNSLEPPLISLYKNRLPVFCLDCSYECVCVFTVCLGSLSYWEI